MKKRLMTVLLTLIATLCLVFALVACGDGLYVKHYGGGTGEGNNDKGSDIEQGNTPNPDEDEWKEPEEHVHSFTDYVYNNDATCTEDGTETASCSCGVSDTRTKVGSALGHEFEIYGSDYNATCVEDSTETAVCNRCSAKDTRVKEGTAFGHSYTKYVFNHDSTCTEDGTETATCARCGERNEDDTRTKVGSARHKCFCGGQPCCNYIGNGLDLSFIGFLLQRRV